MEEELNQIILPEPAHNLSQCRKWFQAAVDSGRKWREEAKEDYEFVAGKQWTEEEIQAFQDDGRPAITINRILPLLNILSGYQRLNRYDIDFLARTADDVDLCQVRRGITKYVFDRCEYDSVERENENRAEIDPLYYSSELKKVRVVECWYKERVQKAIVAPNGQIAQIPIDKVKLCVFFDRTMLEEISSPYQHGEFPYVPMIYHHYGVGDTPAGFVRALKDPQREVNKRRIQELHLLNTSTNGGGWIEEGVMSPEQESEFKRMNNVPGHFQKVTPGGLDRIREREPKNPPVAVIQAEQQAAEDIKTISGINESLLGVDVPSQASGRAIELRQKQAVTHLAVIFDSLRRAKKRIANLLWGRRGHAGVIPQFYTAEKVYRVEGENGQEFITVNEQVAAQDPIAGVILKIINDLSQGEFDIVIADVEASAT